MAVFLEQNMLFIPPPFPLKLISQILKQKDLKNWR